MPPSRSGEVLARVADRVGLAGLAMFAFGYVAGRALANVGLGLLLVALLLALPRCAGLLRSDPLVRLGLAWMAYCAGLAAWASTVYPHSRQYESLPEVWSFAFIPLVALATRGNDRRVMAALLLALAGLMYRLAKDAHFGNGPIFDYADTALGGGRNLAVLFIDVGALGAVALLLGLATLRGWPVARRAPAMAVVGACLAVLMLAWVSARSRTSLVALPLAVTVLLLRDWLGSGQFQRARLAGAGLGLALLAVVLTHLPEIGAELGKDADTWRAIASGRLDAVAIDATGYRIHMWQLAYARWIEHPLTGVGPHVSHLLGGDPQRPFLAAFNQFHSGFVELLLRAGLIGAAVVATAATLIARSARQALREGGMTRRLHDFLVLGLLVFLLLNVSNSILFFQQGWHFLVLFGGVAYGYRWRPAADPTLTRP